MAENNIESRSLLGSINLPGENNCFLNCIIQMVLETDDLKQTITEHICQKEKCILCGLKTYILNYKAQNNSTGTMSDYISPEGLDDALSIKMCAETASPLSSLSLGTSNSSDPYQKEIVKLIQQVLQLQNEKKSVTVRLKGMDPIEIFKSQQTKHENQTLKNQLKEVVQMNTRWQQHNDERENAPLKQKVEQAQAKVPTFTEEQQQQIDRLLLQAKERIEHEREEKERVQGDLHAADMTISQQEEEIQRLSTLLETEGSAGQRPQDRELIEFLQCQIQSCTEDFELERRDREAAQTKISDLESELQYVKDQLAYLQRQQHGKQRREEALPMMYRDGHNATHNAQGLVSRGREKCVTFQRRLWV